MSSPFIGRGNDGFKRQSTYVYQKDIVTYYDKPVIVYPNPDDKDTFYVDLVSTELERKNRQDFMNSFRGDVGVLNIVRKLAMQGENAADGRFAVSEDSYSDLTILPKSKEELDRLMAIKNKVWASLDPELKGNMSFEEFCESWDDSRLESYLDSKASASQSVSESENSEKEGN